MTLVDGYFAAIPGDAGVLRGESSRLDEIAAAIAKLTQSLRAVADEDLTIGDAADALRDRTRAAADDVARVGPRYQETAGALSEFAVALDDAQSRVAQLRGEVASHEQTLAYSEPRLRDLEEQVTYATMAGDDPALIADLQRQQSYHRSAVADAQAGITSAWNRYAVITDEWHAAANAAAARIRLELGVLNDSFWDGVGNYFENLGEFLIGVAEWVGRILDTVLTGLLLLVAAVIALVFALVFVLAFAQFLALLLATGVMTIDQFVEFLVGVTLIVAPILTTVFTALMLRELLTPTPTVRPSQTTLGGRVVDKGERSDYQFLFENNGDLDREGGRDNTVVEIVQVLDETGTPALDEFGNPIWRVTLPSTQDWQYFLGGAGGDAGAVNDLGSNLVLILNPEMQAAYERAVLQAMHDAGIGPQDSVMLAGWSQGGILAGAIASDPESGFNIRAIAVAGAPIDHMPIPPDVSVIAIQHDGDIVPRLDGSPPRQDANWVTITEPYPPGGDAHDASQYATTAASFDTEQRHADYPNLHVLQEQQSMFFSDYELANRYEFSETSTAIL